MKLGQPLQCLAFVSPQGERILRVVTNESLVAKLKELERCFRMRARAIDTDQLHLCVLPWQRPELWPDQAGGKRDALENAVGFDPSHRDLSLHETTMNLSVGQFSFGRVQLDGQNSFGVM